MKNKLILFICLIANISFGQNLRPLAYEFARCDVETALIWSSGGIDDHPIWSPDSKKIAINDMGIWRKLSLDEVYFNLSDWLNNTIGQNISDSFEEITTSEIEEYTDTTIYAPRKLITREGLTVELRMIGFQTQFQINEKILWQTGGDNCHSLSLSPDGNYVAFISESNGLMIYCLNKKELLKQLSNHVKLSNTAINNASIGKFHKAEKIWDKIIVAHKDYSEAFFGKALIQLSQDNTSQAIDYIDKAISIDSNVSTYYFTKARIYEKLGKTDHAIENYKNYIKLKPTDLYGYYYLAELYQSAGLDSQACENFKLAKKYHSRRAQKRIDELCETE